MRLIDVDDEKLRRKLMGIREAEWQIYGKSSCFRFTTKCIDAIDEAPTVEATSTWIPCNKKIPDCGKDVLIRHVKGPVEIAHRVSSNGRAYCWECRDFRIFESKYVTYWSPIPEL